MLRCLNQEVGDPGGSAAPKQTRTRHRGPVVYPRIEPLEPRLLLSGSLTAEFVQVDNSSALSGYKTYDIMVTSDVGWMAAELLVDLTQGSVYQDAAGTERPPNEQLIDAFPTLAYDTYIDADGQPLSILGRASELGGKALRFDSSGIDITWLDLDDRTNGTFHLGRVTLSDDAAGYVGLNVFSLGQNTLEWGTFSAGDLTDITDAPPRPRAEPEKTPTVEPTDYTARFVEVDNAPILNGYRTYDLQITSDKDWTIASMLLELDSGSIYQDAMGSNIEPPAGMSALYPSLAFDSYVTTNGNEAAIAGGAGDLGGDNFQFDSSELDVAWFDVRRNDVGVFSIARITLSKDASGSIKLFSIAGNEHIILSQTFTSGRLPNQYFVPAGDRAPKLPPPPAPITAEFVEVEQDAALAGYKTFDLVVKNAKQWTGASLMLDLSQGSIYQDPAGSELAPNSKTLNAFPTLAFDTFVSSNERLTTINGDADGAMGDGYRFDDRQLSVSWASADENTQDTMTIGRFTLSADAAGSIRLNVTGEANELTESGSFELGNLVAVRSTNTPASAAGPDFTGDRKADILWQNEKTGQINLWQMNRTSLMETIPIQIDLGPTWQAVATGDLTGDGDADILWRNTRNGRNLVTEMDGTHVESNIDIKRLRNRDWKVAGIADLTGDGKADILWRNDKDGRNSVWEMDGTTFTEGFALKSVKSQNWIIAGATDFTGDGKADILWRNTQNGKNAVWEMDGLNLENKLAIQSLKKQTWQIVGVGDYTGDGMTDILWHNARNGGNVVWSMDHLTTESVIRLQKQTSADLDPVSPLLGLWEYTPAIKRA